MSIQTSEDNTFTRYSAFISRDHRQNRPIDKTKAGMPYNVTADFMFNRHSVMLPPDLVEGMTILDIGSCYGTTGAWCLDNGAAHYTGLEPQKKFVDVSRDLLGTYFEKDRFTVIQDSFDTFNTAGKWDIIVASGVLYGVYDQYQGVEKLTRMATESVVIESQHPFLGGKLLFSKTIDKDWLRYRMRNLNIIQVTDETMMVDADSDSNYSFVGSMASVAALTVLFNKYGWQYDKKTYDLAESNIPEIYDVGTDTGSRYMARYFPGNQKKETFTEVISNPKAKKISWHSGNSTSQ
jgi:hypothetical protein